MATDKKIVMLRYPKQLVDSIDDMITSSGLYFSRSDYVLNAVRSLLKEISEEYASVFTASEQRKELIGTYFMNGSMMLAKANQKIKGFDGETISIAVQLPVKILQTIEEYADILLFYRNVQDFIKMAIFTQREDYFTDVIKENADTIRACSTLVGDEPLFEKDRIIK